MVDLKEKLELIGASLSFFIPETVLIAGIILLIVAGLSKKGNGINVLVPQPGVAAALNVLYCV